MASGPLRSCAILLSCGFSLLLAVILYPDVEARTGEDRLSTEVQGMAAREGESEGEAENEAGVGVEAPVAEEEVTSPQDGAASEQDPGKSGEAATRFVYVIPIQGPISKPTLFIIRRGIKQAIANQVDVILLDMNTPGGRADVTLELMEILDRFKGETVTFVNVDAISAGAFIAAATDEIYFAPKSQMGAAALVSGTGEEIPETMREKFESYMLAKIRNYAETDPYRAMVIRAMMELDYVLEIDGEVLKPAGTLLTLTTEEALREYGDPPRPLLGAGIEETFREVLDQKFGSSGYEIKEFGLTWSEKLAQYLDTIIPIFMGIGILCLVIEFKTPGFGIIGGLGIAVLLMVFASNYVAGLAGHEAVLIFLLGLVLIGFELFVFPGTVFPAFFGVALILGALIWSMADIWPSGPSGIDFDPAALLRPLQNLMIGLLIAIVGAVLVWRFLPKSWYYDILVLSGGVAPADPVTAGGGSSLDGSSQLPEIDSEGLAATDLHPMGEVTIEGKRYQATLGLGTLERGSSIKVVGYRNFALLVERIE